MTRFTVAAFYHFAPIADPKFTRDHIEAQVAGHEVKGTILVAGEGLNGTIAGPEAGVMHAISVLKSIEGFSELSYKLSHASDENPFLRLKVRLKKEIVTMGVEGIDPNKVVGTYVPADEWNDLITRDDVVLIDTRNDYEVSIGTFEGAIDPRTTNFREFPEWFRARKEEFAGKKIAMFCTGGIRCEKATSFVKQEGFDEVFHLDGGILKYLENIPEPASKYDGDCFVFDYRVSVTHGLEEGDYDMCHACRMPISAADKASDKFVQGVSCPHCYDTLSDEKRARFIERQKQIDLARARGEAHLAGSVPSAK